MGGRARAGQHVVQSNDDGGAAAVVAGLLPPAGRLLVMSVVDAHGLFIVQTIWAIAADRHGRRETRFESVAGALLSRRLCELADEMRRGYLVASPAAAAA